IESLSPIIDPAPGDEFAIIWPGVKTMEVNLAECSGQLKLDHIPFGPLQRDGSALRSHPTDSASRDRAVHDLGNLLQIVSSGIKVAQRCIREGRSDDAISLLAQVDASVHRAGGFARETLQCQSAFKIDP
ncbi:hypothetical protein, partial [uncultured Bradyrhizobium sp.]|uniref:hypothetical protein n=1 Tax=uncultured Bradyrhizobium sp. TaxID=199684 RepID=UPI00262A1147